MKGAERRALSYHDADLFPDILKLASIGKAKSIAVLIPETTHSTFLGGGLPNSWACEYETETRQDVVVVINMCYRVCER